MAHESFQCLVSVKRRYAWSVTNSVSQHRRPGKRRSEWTGRLWPLVLLLAGCRTIPNGTTETARPPGGASALAAPTSSSNRLATGSPAESAASSSNRLATGSPAESAAPILSASDIGKRPLGILDCSQRSYDSWRRLPIPALRELLGKGGSGCARAILAERLLEQAHFAEEFREAARLLVAGHDQGALTGQCDAFELGIGMSQDLRRAAQCYLRLGLWLPLAVLHAGGIGVPRDPSLARAMYEFVTKDYKDCTSERVEGLIGRAPPAEGYQWCRDAACTTLDRNTCQVSENLRERWLAAERREAVTARFDEPKKRQLGALMLALDGYAEADSRCVYQQYIGGTMRNGMALQRQADIRQSFEQMLLDVVGQRIAKSATTDLGSAQRELAAGLQLQLNADLLDPAEKRDLVALCRRASAAFDKYRAAWFAFNKHLSSSSSARDLETVLVRERTKLLRDQAQ